MKKMKKTMALAMLNSLLCIFFVANCAGSQKSTKFVKEPMPEEGNFDGVYQSTFGRMELTVDGNKVVGFYEGEQRYGRIEGTVNGDLLFFSWVQWGTQLGGKTRKTKGCGVFKYKIEYIETSKGPKGYHKLEGQWGFDKEEYGNVWTATKLSLRSKKRLQPKGDAKNSKASRSSDYSGFEPSDEGTGVGLSSSEDEEKPEEEDTLDDLGIF